MSVALPTFAEIAKLPRSEWAAFVADLPDDLVIGLQRQWWFWARPEQLWSPGPETYTVTCAGRGSGKTRAAVETTLLWAADEAQTGGYMLFVGATNNDVEGTMLYGEAGFVTLGSITPGLQVRHYKGRYEVIKVSAQGPTGKWRETCSVRFASAEKPDRMRGPTVGRLWYDELGAMPLARAEDNVWAQRTYVLRKPVEGGVRGLVTMTPKPTDAIRELFRECYEPQCPACNLRSPKLTTYEQRQCRACSHEWWPDVRIIGGSIYDNAANIDARTIAAVDRLKGTRLYEQEAKGALIEDVAGALFHQHTFHLLQSQLRRGTQVGRDTHEQAVRRELELQTVVVAVDPSGSVSKTSCESGVVVVAKQGHGDSLVAVVCEDASVRAEDVAARQTMTAAYARAAADAAWRWGAETIAIETNNGGDAVIEVLQSAVNALWRERGETQARPQVLAVWAHASKVKRAEFMSIEQTAEPSPRVKYLVLHGEDGQAKWAPLKASLTSLSPQSDTGKRDRADAAVHGHRVIHDPAAAGGAWEPIADWQD